MISFEYNGVEFRVFDHLFAVSRDGDILRNFTPYTPTIRGDGYIGVGRQRLLHRVVATCWIDNPTKAKCVHHKNGDRFDNRADNLEWLTQKEHAVHHKSWGQYKRTQASIAKFIVSRTGVKDSAESAAVKRKNLDKVRPSTVCKFKGVTYPSVSAAARFVGIPAPTFRLRCLSKNFPEYELVSCFYSR